MQAIETKQKTVGKLAFSAALTASLAFGTVSAMAGSGGSSTGSYNNSYTTKSAGSSTGSYTKKSAGSSTGSYSGNTAGYNTGTYAATPVAPAPAQTQIYQAAPATTTTTGVYTGTVVTAAPATPYVAPLAAPAAPAGNYISIGEYVDPIK